MYSRTFAEAFAETKTLPQAPVDLHLVICQDKDLTASTCGPSPRQLPRQKPYHKHPCNITEAFAKTKTLPQAPADLHRDICQDKNIASTCGPSPRLSPRQRPYRKHLWTFTSSFAKTKTLPQAPADLPRGICQDKNLTASFRETSPRHSPRQKPYHKHPRNITEAFAKTKTLPQASAKPRQKPDRKHLRTFTGASAKTKTLPEASVKHHRSIRQDKNLTTSIR